MTSSRNLAIKFVTHIYRGRPVDEFSSLSSKVLREIFDEYIPVHRYLGKSVNGFPEENNDDNPTDSSTIEPSTDRVDLIEDDSIRSLIGFSNDGFNNDFLHLSDKERNIAQFHCYLKKFRTLYWSNECYFLLFIRLNSLPMIKEIVTLNKIENLSSGAVLAIIYGHVEIFRYLYRRIPRSRMTLCEFAQIAKDHGNKKILDMMLSYGADVV